MQFTVLQENLKNALRVLSKVVPAKPQLPILSTILCTVANGEVTLSATDLYMGVTIRLPASIEEEGVLAIPGRTFIETINSLSAGKLELKAKEQRLQIVATTTKSSIQSLPADEYPSFPDKVGQPLTLATETLQIIDDKLGFCVSADQARLVLTTVFLNPVENSVEAVATDGIRLGKVIFTKEQVSIENPLMIPAAALSEAYKIATQGQKKQIEITLSEEQKQLFFTVDDVTLYVRLVEGQFPPYQKIFPTSFATEVVLDGESFTEHLKQAQVMAKDVANVVTLEFTTENVITSVIGASQGSFSATLPNTSFTGTAKTLSFNSRYLLDFLTKTKPTQIYIGFNDEFQPVLFRHADDESYHYIVKPFRPNQA